MVNKNIVLSLCLCLNAIPNLGQSSQLLNCKIEEVNQKWNVRITLSENVVDSWKSVSYEPVEAEEAIVRYLDILLIEYSKYPPNYLSQAHISSIVLTQNLRFNGQPRAAIPDPYKNQLYLSVNGAFGIDSHRYLTHVMHHELHHCTEYAIWKSMSYDWIEWYALNSQDFCYGDGGSSAYVEYLANGTDFYTPTNPIKGFVNRYSLTGDEEDRAELLAFLMTDADRPVVERLIKHDDVIHKKTLLLCELLSGFANLSIEFPHVR